MTREIYLFLSSPGDCDKERQHIRDIVDALNKDPACLRDGIVIRIQESDGVPYSAVISPQRSVNDYRKRPEECDLFVCIFRNRFGSPTATSHTKPDGTPCKSGTEYEFCQAYTNAERTERQLPFMLTYQYIGATDQKASKKQLKLIKKFFNSPPFADEEGRCTAGYHSYSTLDQFMEQFQHHLKEYLFNAPWFDGWMKKMRNRLVDDAGPRYTKAAHVETDIMKPFKWLLRTDSTFQKTDESLAELYQSIPFSELNSKSLKADYLSLEGEFRTLAYWRDGLNLQAINDLLVKTENAIKKPLTDASQALDKLPAEQRESFSDEHKAAMQKIERLQGVNGKIWSVRSILKNASLVTKRVLLITGKAGMGKTHALVEEVSRYIDAGNVAVGILGQKLRNVTDLRAAILQQFKSQNIRSFEELLTILNRKAEDRGSMALIAIDALNESRPRSCWQDELDGILADILSYPHIAVALSVRDDYKRQTLPTIESNAETSWHQEVHHGFAGVEPEALQRYFAHNSIVFPVYPPILPEFSNPLYLKILCSTLNSKSLAKCPIPVPSWLDVHKAWLDEIEIKALRLKDELGLDDGKNRQVYRVIAKIADTLIEHDATAILRRDAEEIAREVAGERKSNFISFLISEQLFFEYWHEESNDDLLSFGYERISDTFQADRLLNKYAKDESKKYSEESVRAVFASTGQLHAYLIRDVNGKLVNRNGILRAFMLMVPRIIGKELPASFSNDKIDVYSVADAWSDSLLWRTGQSEFGADTPQLKQIMEKMRKYLWRTPEEELDFWIRISVIPTHPFSMTCLLHPWLKAFTMAERDAKWTNNLIPLWDDDQSMLRLTVQWSANGNHKGIAREVAWCLGLLLTWCCSSSNTGLRESAGKGLCRLIVAYPEITEDLLREFVECDDAYIVENLLIAVLGAILNSNDINWISRVGQLVYGQHFTNGNAKWCHLHIRFYAMRIVNRAFETGCICGRSIPRFSSTLPLDSVPTKKQLKDEANKIRGQFRIVFSSTDNDFYRYILGANSASIPFSSKPLPESKERDRPHLGKERPAIGFGHAKPEVFDICLTGRFVAWNCLQLGWSAELFNEFDDSHWISSDRIIHGAKTERIGKKYQWIGWRTLQAFLSDNYFVRKRYSDELIEYKIPADIDEVVIDPLLWLLPEHHDERDVAPFSLNTDWPEWDKDSIKKWHNNPDKEPSFINAIEVVPKALQDIALGAWYRLTVGFTWEPGWRPGRWDQTGKSSFSEQYFTVWLLAWAKLIKKTDLGALKKKLRNTKIQQQMQGHGRCDYPHLEHVSLDQWANTHDPEVDGFKVDNDIGPYNYWPVDYAELFARDSVEDHFTLPAPWLIREWQLSLDLTTGIYSLPDGRPLFFNTYFRGGRDEIYAHITTLREMLDKSGWELTWLVRSEQHASLGLHDFSRVVSMHGLAVLEKNHINILWKNNEQMASGS